MRSAVKPVLVFPMSSTQAVTRGIDRAPSWMSGAFQVGQLNITYGRLWIVVFALIVFASLILLLRKTPLGLYMRAVTQNRRMASAIRRA